jgi:hypothetical protein
MSDFFGHLRHYEGRGALCVDGTQRLGVYGNFSRFDELSSLG